MLEENSYLCQKKKICGVYNMGLGISDLLSEY